MKKIIQTIITACLLHQAFGQLNIGTGSQWVVTGNASVVLQDLGLVNNGSLSPGTGSFKFMGSQDNTIGGNNISSFYIIEIAKTNNAKTQLGRNMSVASSINFITGQLDLDGNSIFLSPAANIAGETETNRITGANGGRIEITQNLNSPNGSNPGNLGAFITSTADLGQVTIRRGHTDQSGTGLSASIRRYYEIIPANNSALNATLRIKYFDAEQNGQTETGLVLYQSTDGGVSWNNLSQTSRSANSNYVEKTGINSFGLQTLGNDVQSLNGVTGLVFTGQRKKPTEVQLKWSSQTETNLSGYQVQRKLDTEPDFTDRFFVNTPAINGNSISPLNYEHVDGNAHTGSAYYRLKMISVDNSFSYSNVVTVAGKTKGKGGNNNNLTLSGGEETTTGKVTGNTFLVSKKITIGPNPNNGNFWFSVNGIEKEAIAALFSSDGKQLQRFKIVNLQRQQVSGLRSGMYLLKVPGFEAQKIIVSSSGDTVPGSQQVAGYNLKF